MYACGWVNVYLFAVLLLSRCGLALLRCILNSAARKMWVCVWGGRAVVVGGNLSYFCLLPANLRGGRVVTGPLEGLLPAGNVVSGVYIVCALFEYKKWIFSVYIVYAFFIFCPLVCPLEFALVKKCTHINICISAAGILPAAFFVYTLSYAYHLKFCICKHMHFVLFFVYVNIYILFSFLYI